MQKPKIAIAGAGTMGASIAQIYARFGHDVLLYDLYPEGLEKGRGLIRINRRAAIEAGSLTERESAELVSRIRFTDDISGVADADLLIETIIERMDVKLDFWEKASALAGSDAILATNTSGLSITEMSKAVRLPERFCGMHWINPPHLVPLVEVIKGEKTSDAAARAVYDSALSVGKKPVVVRKDAPGFVLNRLQFAVLREAMNIVESGVAGVEEVDDVFKYGLGMRYAAIGPFETADLGGLDTFYHIASYLFADLAADKAVPKMLAERYSSGDLGVKTGKGFYDYPGDEAENAVRRRDLMFMRLAKCLFESESTSPSCQ